MVSTYRSIEPDGLLTEVQASRILSLSTRTLQAWRIQGKGPRFVRAGRAVRYRPADITSWIEGQVVIPATCEQGECRDG